MLCDLGLSAETQTQLYRKSSRKPSLPLVRRLFLAESLPHNRGPVLIASSIDWSKGKDTRRTPAEWRAWEKTTLGGNP